MRKGTSGFWLEETENEIRIGYTDYGVSEYGGGDYEKTYVLVGENAQKFREALASAHKGTLKQMIKSAFGKHFSDQTFWDFCRNHAIEYTWDSWTSYEPWDE